MRVLAAGLALLLAGSACASAGDRRGEAARGDLVYEIHLTMDPPGECEGEPSCVLVRHVTWVAPDAKAWRTESEDGSGFTTTEVSASGMYLVEHFPPSSRDVRIGSRAHLGLRADLPIGFERFLAEQEHALGHSIDVEEDGMSYTLTLEAVIPLAEADRRGLFAISTEEPGTTVSRELAPGDPTALAVRAYWFGPKIAGREAFTALDHDGDEVLHVTFYGDPAEIAAGKTHAYRGREVPERELQVVSRARHHPAAQRELKTLEGGDAAPLRATKVRLASGEEATLFPSTGGEGGAFAVVTRTTLITVSGVSGDAARRIAPLLRPLRAQSAGA
ncbi:MAG TPA: hypothetical protein VE644_09875 [Gaiellaceae bacterium]|nr:hypothetical protein [Gaiellaceae bacterium]